jgi:hypothetical protein
MSDDLYTKDDVRWDKEADDVRHKALDDVRSLSSKWEGTVATILGLFSTVAIVTGPASFDKITYTWVRWTALALIAAAGIAAFVGVYHAAQASQGPDPKLLNNLDGAALQADSFGQVEGAVRHLKWSRKATFLAAGALFAAGILVAADAAQSAGQTPARSSVVVVDQNGTITCGKLGTGKNNETTVGGKAIIGARQVIAVSKC